MVRTHLQEQYRLNSILITINEINALIIKNSFCVLRSLQDIILHSVCGVGVIQTPTKYRYGCRNLIGC